MCGRRGGVRMGACCGNREYNEGSGGHGQAPCVTESRHCAASCTCQAQPPGSAMKALLPRCTESTNPVLQHWLMAHVQSHPPLLCVTSHHCIPCTCPCPPAADSKVTSATLAAKLESEVVGGPTTQVRMRALKEGVPVGNEQRVL